MEDERYDRQIEARIGKLETRVDSLIAWRNWVLGMAAGMGMLVGAFAKNAGDILRHML